VLKVRNRYAVNFSRTANSSILLNTKSTPVIEE